MSQGSKTDTAVKLVLIFFISLLSFSVGTFVGKQVSDADHRRASLEIEADDSERGVASIEGHEPDPAAISDEEVASLTKEFMDAERSVASESNALSDDVARMDEEDTSHADSGYSQMHGKEKAKAEHKAEAHGDAIKKAATRISKDMAPTKDKVQKRKPSSTLPVAVAASSVGKYTVQIGSYASEEEAKAYATKMKDKGYSAFYVPADVKGQTWYRVSLGLYPDTKSAEDYKNSLIAKNVVKAAIVQKIVK